MKLKLLVPFALCTALLLSGCDSTSEAPSTPPAPSQTTAATQYAWDFAKKTTDIDALKAECDQKGTVVSMEYETPLYAVDPEQTATKTLYVYLPYGYDEATEYNILYLMHGGGESAEYWLAGERWGPTTCNVLDNMIKDGLCDPFIVVTPTFYPPTEETEDAEVAEGPEASSELTVTFAQELREQIIPLVESAYSTYAGGDVSPENLAATREHRAFAGFSMGSMTSIHSALMQCPDLFSWVGSFSGAKTEVADFQAALESEDFKDLSFSFWYNGNGKGDIAHDEHDEFCHAVLEAMPERFTDGENFAWVDFRDGTHSYASWLADLYNCMLVFFK